MTQILRRAKNVSTISCFELCHYYSLLNILIQNQLLWFYVNAQTWFHIDIHIAPMISSSMDISSPSQNSAVVLPSTSNKVYFLFLLPHLFSDRGSTDWLTWALSALFLASRIHCTYRRIEGNDKLVSWRISIHDISIFYEVLFSCAMCPLQVHVHRKYA